MRIKNKEIKNSTIAKPKKNLSMILLFGLMICILCGGIFFGLSKLFATDTYYVLNADVPAKTQITRALLIPQETAQGTAPKNAVDMNEVQKGNVYAKYSLYQGDVVSTSNAGAITNSYDGIPDSWVITSLTISADKAVDGGLTKGDYFDIIRVNGGQGKYLAIDALVLDVNSSTAQTQDDKGAKTNAGANLVYTVGLPQKLAPAVHAAIMSSEDVHFVRSPLAARYEKREIDGLDANVTSENEELTDLMKGTDPTFSPVVRDVNSRPVNKETCQEGKIKPANLCKINGFETNK